MYKKISLPVFKTLTWCTCIIVRKKNAFLETKMLFFNHNLADNEMDTTAQDTQDREQRHRADTEHIFKREAIFTPQAAIKHLAVYPSTCFSTLLAIP